MKYIGENFDLLTLRFGATRANIHRQLSLFFKSEQLLLSPMPTDGTEIFSLKIKQLDCYSQSWKGNSYSIQYGIIGFDKEKAKKYNLNLSKTFIQEHDTFDKNLMYLINKYDKYDPQIYSLYFGCFDISRIINPNSNNGHAPATIKRFTCTANIDEEMEKLYDSTRNLSINRNDQTLSLMDKLNDGDVKNNESMYDDDDHD